jgi:single-strand selective monofunctional uracil DNA glycosylase
MKNLVSITKTLNSKIKNLKFTEPVTHVYNPLDYAEDLVEKYLTIYGEGSKEVFFLGMNPGPFGMAQTGIPFGEIDAVRDWLKLDGVVTKPKGEHPDRPIMGFDCHRSEVSGKRIWGLFQQQFKTPELFFSKHFVWNFCPLLFSEIHRNNGKKVCRNLTPDKIKSAETVKLYKACDQALVDFIDVLSPKYLVGVGAFAETCLKRIFPDRKKDIYRMLHPSPASPIANRDFAGTAIKQMREFGIWDNL